MEKIVYLLEDSKILDLEENEGYYDEKRMLNVVVKNGEKIPLISSDIVLITETKTKAAPGDDDDDFVGL
jgi:hypothetical protein